MISLILEYSEKIKTPRSLHSRFLYAAEEFGELATEIMIEDGISNKPPGKDGIIGEAVDVIVCLVDLIKKYDPNITEEQLTQICLQKLEKWKAKSF